MSSIYKLDKKDKISINGTTLYRLIVKKNMPDYHLKKGDKGGYVGSLENVSGNARVYGDARVYGNARVYGDAKFFIQIQGSRHFINYTGKDSIIKIGCYEKTYIWWLKNFKSVGESERYSAEQINEYKKYIDLIGSIYGFEEKWWKMK